MSNRINYNRFPIPRPIIIALVAFIVFGGVVLCMKLHEARDISNRIEALNGLKVEMKSVPVYAEIRDLKTKRTYALVVVLLGGDFILSCSYFLYLNLKREYCFCMFGDSYSTRIEVSSGDTVVIGPLQNLEEKALLVALNSKLPQEALPKVESFRFYKKPLPRPEIDYHLQLSGADNDIIAKEVLKQIMGSSWEKSREYSREEHHNTQLPVSLQQSSPEYYLQIIIDGDHNETGALEPTDSRLSIQLDVKLKIGLRAKKIFGYQSLSFEGPLANVA